MWRDLSHYFPEVKMGALGAFVVRVVTPALLAGAGLLVSVGGAWLFENVVEPVAKALGWL